MKESEEIIQALLKFRNERDWEQFHNPKDLALAINDFPPELFHYGLDFYSCLIANENNLKIGVSDNLTICHLENQTAKSNLIEGFTENSFPSQANTNMINYFMNSPYKDKFLELREKGSQYHA